MVVVLILNHISFSINWEESLSALKQLGEYPNVDKYSYLLRSFVVHRGKVRERTDYLDKSFSCAENILYTFCKTEATCYKKL